MGITGGKKKSETLPIIASLISGIVETIFLAANKKRFLFQKAFFGAYQFSISPQTVF